VQSNKDLEQNENMPYSISENAKIKNYAIILNTSIEIYMHYYHSNSTHFSIIIQKINHIIIGGNIMNKEFDYNLIRFLIAVVEEKTMAGAAAKLKISPSGVTYAITKLRNHYNDPMFIKSIKGVQPTNFTLYLYDVYKPIANHLDNVIKINSNTPIDDTTKRVYRVRANSIIEYGLSHLAMATGIINESCAFYYVKNTSNPEERLSKLRKKEVDIDIGFALDKEVNIYSEHLFNIELTVICRADHPRVGNYISTEDFISEKHVGWVNWQQHSELSSEIDSIIELRSRNVFILSESFPTLLSLIEESDYLMFAPSNLIPLLTSKFNIKEVKVDMKTKNRGGIYAYFHKDKKDDDNIKKIVKLMKKVHDKP
jgi:DNA-binding transcriptional LysR family regulator